MNVPAVDDWLEFRRGVTASNDSERVTSAAWCWTSRAANGIAERSRRSTSASAVSAGDRSGECVVVERLRRVQHPTRDVAGCVRDPLAGHAREHPYAGRRAVEPVATSREHA